MIEDQAQRLEHKLGWRFLTSPLATLSKTTELALVTLNPGGRQARSEHPRETNESGSCYRVESWRGQAPGKSPLQQQVRALFAMLASVRGLESGGDALLDACLSGQFVPFRSPTWSTLANPRESLEVATTLWTGVFRYLDPKLTITIDLRTFRAMCYILNRKWGTEAFAEHHPTGWGRVQAELLLWDSASGKRALLRLPHLSRFRLFGRDASRSHMEDLLRRATEWCW